MAARIPQLVLLLLVCVYVTCSCGQGASANPVAENTQQSLQAVLYSIEERLRGLDLLYAPRYAPPRHWDTEQYTRRLDAIEARTGRIEALLELRLDKITEAVSSNQMKQTLATDHTARKIDSLYERLNHRMGYTENRLDLDVAKIQASIESGFSRVARTERDSENFVDVDLETQIQEMQRQFDTFEINQNTTLSKLLEISSKSCKNPELNDAGNQVEERDLDKKDIEQFAQSMENVATKVNKMVTDFSLRTQVMESLVKDSMSLSNATRRELQEGLKTWGMRMFQQTKHSKEKETFFEFGSDALASLIRKEFENLGEQLQKNQDKLVAAQDDFRHSCHLLQESEEKLSTTVALALDGMLDLIRNRSTAMSKQMSTFQEILKHHNTQILSTVNRTTYATHRAQQIDGLHAETVGSGQQQMWEKLQDSMINILAGIQVIQDQISEMSTIHPGLDDVKEGCPDSEVIADKILATITSKQIQVPTNQVNISVISGLIDKLITAINATKHTVSDKTKTKDASIINLETNLEEPANSERYRKQRTENKSEKDEPRGSHILDILEEDLGKTLHYNVTQDETLMTDHVQGKDVNDNITEEIDDYEHSSSEVEKAEHLDDEEGESNLGDNHSHLIIKNRTSKDQESVHSSVVSSNPAISLSAGKMMTPHIKEVTKTTEHVETNQEVKLLKQTSTEEHQQSGITTGLTVASDSDANQTKNKTDVAFETTNHTETNKNKEAIKHPAFSHLWHKVLNSTINNSTQGNDLSNSGVEVTKGHHNANVNSRFNAKADDSDEAHQGTADDMITSGNQELRFLEQTQIHDNDEYDYDK